MTQPNGDGTSGGGTPPAPQPKPVEEQLKEMQEAQSKIQAQMQSTQEELKRVNNLNGVLMQRLNAGGGSAQPPKGGMDVNNTRPIKLKRDFSSMDPAADPAGFATELVLETAEHVSEAVANANAQQQQQSQLRRAFYDKHKDLVGYEIEVGHFSGEVQVQNPGIAFDQAAELVAQRTREYIKSKGLSGSPADPNAPTPPSALPPSSGGGGPVPIKPPKGEEPYDPDKVAQDDMKDYAAMRNKERDRDGSKKG